MPMELILEEAIDPREITGSIISSVRYLTVESRQVAYFTNSSGNGTRTGVVVPGIVASAMYETEYGLPAIEVEPITDERFMDRVRKLLENQGYVNFW